MLEYVSVRIISSIKYITNAMQIEIWLVDHTKRLEQFPSVQVFLCLKSGRRRLDALRQRRIRLMTEIYAC